MKALLSMILVVVLLFALPGSALADEELEYTSKGADSCLMCHRSAKWNVMGIFETKHGSLTDPNAPFSNLQCEACHGPSAAHTKAKNKAENPPMHTFADDEEATAAEQNAPCMSCHSGHSNIGWMGSAHESSDVACVSCHSVHDAHDAVMDPLGQQEVCFECHQRVRSDTLKAHGHPLRFGSMTCSSCHNVHDGNNDFLLTEDNVNDTCYSCHAEKRGPFLWEHAPATEDCSLCHKPHGSNHPASLTRRPPLLCQQCHSAAGHPSLAYTGDDIGTQPADRFLRSRSCMSCHSQVHGSNHPSGSSQMR